MKLELIFLFKGKGSCDNGLENKDTEASRFDIKWKSPLPNLCTSYVFYNTTLVLVALFGEKKVGSIHTWSENAENRRCNNDYYNTLANTNLSFPFQVIKIIPAV